MEAVESSSTVERVAEISKDTSEGRETSADFNNIQDGGHVASSLSGTTLQQNPLGLVVPSTSIAQVGR